MSFIYAKKSTSKHSTQTDCPPPSKDIQKESRVFLVTQNKQIYSKQLPTAQYTIETNGRQRSPTVYFTLQTMIPSLTGRSRLSTRESA